MPDYNSQLVAYLDSCPELKETLAACTASGVNNYYIGAGAITQLIWNNLSGRPNLHKVKDIDIVYFADVDLEPAQIDALRRCVSHDLPLDIVNQARVHEWYHHKFGNRIEAFTKVEDGIDTWLSAVAIGVRKITDYEIYAPFGLQDAFTKTLRPNKRTMSKQNYLDITSSFKRRWNDLSILPWD